MKLAKASKIKIRTFPRLRGHLCNQGETFEAERIKNMTEGAVIRLSLRRTRCVHRWLRARCDSADAAVMTVSCPWSNLTLDALLLLNCSAVLLHQSDGGKTPQTPSHLVMSVAISPQDCTRKQSSYPPITGNPLQNCPQEERNPF